MPRAEEPPPSAHANRGGPLATMTRIAPHHTAASWRGMTGGELAVRCAEHATTEGYQRAVAEALTYIETALDDGPRRWYVGVSGGKDSDALAHLVARVDPGVDRVYFADELIHDDHWAYVERLKARWGDRLVGIQCRGVHKSWHVCYLTEPHWTPLPDWVIPRPELPREQWFSNAGVADALAMGYRGGFLGVRKEESQARTAYLSERRGGLYPDIVRPEMTYSAPLMDWTWMDVWTYVLTEVGDYCPVYDRLMEIGVSPRGWRVGPLALAEEDTLRYGWPELYRSLVATYGPRWTRAGYKK